MIGLLIYGGVFAAAGAALYILILEIGGLGTPPAWTREVIAGGLAASVLGWLVQRFARRWQQIFRRRCIQCGREAVKGSIYCAPHLREATILERERAELDRL